MAKNYKERIRTNAICEEDLKAYYYKNLQQFQVPEQIRGRMILVKSKQEAMEILELLKTGAGFGDLALERSIDPSAKNGGVFGWQSRGRMHPAIEDEVFKLRKGEISQVFTTPSGFYVLQVEDKKPREYIPYSEVEKEVGRNVKSERKKEAIERKARELEEKYQAKTHVEFLSELKVPVAEIKDPREALKMLQEVMNEAVEKPY